MGKLLTRCQASAKKRPEGSAAWFHHWEPICGFHLLTSAGEEHGREIADGRRARPDLRFMCGLHDSCLALGRRVSLCASPPCAPARQNNEDNCDLSASNYPNCHGMSQ